MDADDPLEQLSPRSRAVPRSLKVRLGVGAAAVLLIAAFATAVLVGMLAPRGDSGHVPSVSVTTADSSRSTPEATQPAVLYVHVLGAVQRPGLYTLAAGSRVVDAVGAAGGMTDDAEQSGVNLARLLSDGEQLVVPHVGDPVQQPEAPGSGGQPAGALPGAKVNLNTATEAELDTLPRVGPAMAAKILAWRAENGRFTSIDDLMNVSGIGQKTFDGLKDLVTV
ncbi:helix-hairpin-helix domain-containing protein [Humibacter sp.]|uniref:helix-hairpin-helix domain-containing protein n=1 Tax=Humibacter sp. TaxID=1940291 RepID=UPI002CBB7C38|nr:helix-hairpin-helix domain-containing protein [Humibacter sp.]HVX07834.1 helix-hairpin-helix domain-containing protein [Humibacter sp.]